MKKINQKDYKFYVIIVTPATSTLKIESGWEYKEDAQDQVKEIKEWDGNFIPRVYTKKTCVQKGLDPDFNNSWYLNKKDDSKIEEKLQEIQDSNIGEEFHKAYNKAKTWADLGEMYQALSIDALKKLQEALTITKNFTGLDMRQDFLLTVITLYLKFNS